MDIISQKLGIHPSRSSKNCLATGDETAAGDRANHIALRECLVKVGASSSAGRDARRPSWVWRRIAAQVTDHFRLLIQRARELGSNGKVQLFIGATDVGGGTGTSLGQIVAEELGLMLSDIQVVIADT